MEGSKFAFFDFGYGATDRPVGVKFCMRLELWSGQVSSAFGGHIFRGLQMWDQKCSARGH